MDRADYCNVSFFLFFFFILSFFFVFYKVLSLFFFFMILVLIISVVSGRKYFNATQGISSNKDMDKQVESSLKEIMNIRPRLG